MKIKHSLIGAMNASEARVLDSKPTALDTDVRWFVLEVPVDGIFQEVRLKLPLDGTKKRVGNRLYWVA